MTKMVISEDDDVDEVVHRVDVVRNRRDGLLKVELLRRRLAGARQRRRGEQASAQGSAQPCRNPFAQAPLDHEDIAPKFPVPTSPESHAARLRQGTSRAVVRLS